jgi:membrane peptidoglycan carboxypeptidase
VLTLLKLAGVILAAGILATGLVLPYVGSLGLAAGHEAHKFLNTTCKLQEESPPRPTTVYARDGKTVIARLFTQDRKDIPLSQVPRYLQEALVATEDRRFYEHHGVDLRGLIRSAVSTTGGDTQGGSTLTMQYVKQLRYYQAVKSGNTAAADAAIAVDLNRKMEDAQCALYFENVKHESKGTILNKYLNIAFFGENSYGIETAAQTYFNKHAKDLTLPESATLVGLLRAPSAYDPFQHPQAAQMRRNQVLQNLVDVGDLSEAKATQYAKTPISLATKRPPKVQEGCANAGTTIKNAGFFCDYAQTWLENVQGIKDLDTGGYTITTTLDPDIQNTAQEGVSKAIPATSPMTSMLPVVDPKSGDVLAMASSKLFGTNTSTKDHTHTSLPIFTRHVGQGASTYKLFALLTALSTGVPDDWLLETPTSKKGYQPRNCQSDAYVTNGDANETYNRNESLASATAKSSNTFFVGLADQLLGCDLQPIVDMAKKLGMSGLSLPSAGNSKKTVGQDILQTQNATELVLGAVPTSPLELAGAYAAIANDGRYNQPAPILSIKGSGGKAIAVKRSPGVQVVLPQIARKAVHVLIGDTQDPGTSADAFARWYDDDSSEVAGKTGTATAVNPRTGKDTKENASLWFVGMTPDLVATSALVNLDHPSWPASGLPGVKHPAQDAYGEYASRIWLKALDHTISKHSWSWPTPGSVSGREVPNVVGMSVSKAKRTLEADGYKMVQLDAANQLLCASSEVYGQVAYYGPQYAAKGTTITVCPSSSQGQDVYIKPKPPPPPPPTTRHNNPTTGTGSTRSAPRGGSTSSGTQPSGGSGPSGPGHGHRTKTPHR